VSHRSASLYAATDELYVDTEGGNAETFPPELSPTTSNEPNPVPAESASLPAATDEPYVVAEGGGAEIILRDTCLGPVFPTKYLLCWQN